VHLHFISTHNSWLNQIECWFSILSRSNLRGASFTSVRMLVEAIEAFVTSWNQKAALEVLASKWRTVQVWKHQLIRGVGQRRGIARLVLPGLKVHRLRRTDTQ
jgi:hypothetical protein